MRKVIMAQVQHLLYTTNALSTTLAISRLALENSFWSRLLFLVCFFLSYIYLSKLHYIYAIVHKNKIYVV